MEVRLVQEIILIYFYSLNLEQMEQRCTTLKHLCSKLQFCVTFYYEVLLNLFKILKSWRCSTLRKSSFNTNNSWVTKLQNTLYVIMSFLQWTSKHSSDKICLNCAWTGRMKHSFNILYKKNERKPSGSFVRNEKKMLLMDEEEDWLCPQRKRWYHFLVYCSIDQGIQL